MSKTVASAVAVSNSDAEELFGDRRNDLRLTDALMRVARSLWPTKTAAELSFRAEVSQRSAENWLSLKTGISGPAFGALIACEEGLDFIEATILVKGKLPRFWKNFKKRQRRGNLRADLKRIQHELDLVDDD